MKLRTSARKGGLETQLEGGQVSRSATVAAHKRSTSALSQGRVRQQQAVHAAADTGAQHRYRSHHHQQQPQEQPQRLKPQTATTKMNVVTTPTPRASPVSPNSEMHTLEDTVPKPQSHSIPSPCELMQSSSCSSKHDLLQALHEEKNRRKEAEKEVAAFRELLQSHSSAPGTPTAATPQGAPDGIPSYRARDTSDYGPPARTAEWYKDQFKKMLAIAQEEHRRARETDESLQELHSQVYQLQEERKEQQQARLNLEKELREMYSMRSLDKEENTTLRLMVEKLKEMLGVDKLDELEEAARPQARQLPASPPSDGVSSSFPYQENASTSEKQAKEGQTDARSYSVSFESPFCQPLEPKTEQAQKAAETETQNEASDSGQPALFPRPLSFASSPFVSIKSCAERKQSSSETFHENRYLENSNAFLDGSSLHQSSYKVSADRSDSLQGQHTVSSVTIKPHLGDKEMHSESLLPTDLIMSTQGFRNEGCDNDLRYMEDEFVPSNGRTLVSTSASLSSPCTEASLGSTSTASAPQEYQPAQQTPSQPSIPVLLPRNPKKVRWSEWEQHITLRPQSGA